MGFKAGNHDDEFEEPSMDEETKQIVQDAKKELLLANRRARVTTMSFHDWFTKTYQREFKPSDKPISDAYHAGAADEVENNEYILEHADLKMNHYKSRSVKLADQVQILYSLLDTVSRKVPLPEALKKMIRKALAE